MLRRGRKFLGYTSPTRSSGGSSGNWSFRPSERYNLQGNGSGVKDFIGCFGGGWTSANQNGHDPDLRESSTTYFSCPECPVQGPVLYRLRNVFGFHGHCSFEVGNCSSDFQDAVVGTGSESLLVHGAFQQAFAIRREFAESSDVARAHLCVRIDSVLGGRREPAQLHLPGIYDPIA